MARSIRTISGALLALLLTAPSAFAAGTRHVCSFVSVPGTAATVYASASCTVAENSSGYPWVATELPAPWMAAGTAKNLSITSDVAPGVGKSWTLTFRRSGADTALTTTLSGTNTTATDSTHTLALAISDLVDLQLSSSGSPAGTNISVSWTFDSTNVGESAYIVAPQNNTVPTSFTSFAPAFNFSNNHWSSVEILDTMPIAASMTAYNVVFTVAPGTGKSWVAAWKKNGTVQDGTGGTTDTRITVANAATSGSWTGSLAFSPGDTVDLELVPSGTPAGAYAAVGSKLVATTDGQSVLCGESEDDPSSSVVNYQQILSTTAHGTFPWSTTESSRQATVGPDGFTLGSFYLWFRPGFNPGAGASWTFDVRQNAASPASNPSVTISGSSTTGNDTTHTLAIAGGDAINLRSTPSGSPGSPSWTVWCFAETGLAPITTSFPALTVAP